MEKLFAAIDAEERMRRDLIPACKPRSGSPHELKDLCSIDRAGTSTDWGSLIGDGSAFALRKST
jgi:hypothetical protein